MCFFLQKPQAKENIARKSIGDDSLTKEPMPFGKLPTFYFIVNLVYFMISNKYKMNSIVRINCSKVELFLCLSF